MATATSRKNEEVYPVENYKVLSDLEVSNCAGRLQTQAEKITATPEPISEEFDSRDWESLEENERRYWQVWYSATAFRNARNQPVIEFRTDDEQEGHPVTWQAAQNLAKHLRQSCDIQTVEEVRLGLLSVIQARENQGLRLEAAYWRLCYRAHA